MKLHLPLSLRHVLSAAAAAAVCIPATSYAGIVRDDYNVQDYFDIAQNSGQYAAGSTNVEIFKKDGTSGGTLDLVPDFSSFVKLQNGGGVLVLPQYVASAAHCKIPGSTTGADVIFYIGSNHQVTYSGNTGSGSYGNTPGGYYADTEIFRLPKIVTEATYTPLCTDNALKTRLMSMELFRVGTGASSTASDSGKLPLSSDGKPLGGTSNVTTTTAKDAGAWYVNTTLAKNAKEPLSIGADSGDSGSPLYVYNAANHQFEVVGTASTANIYVGWNNTVQFSSNVQALQAIVANMTQTVNITPGGTILWEPQNNEAQGVLRQGDTTWNYYGQSSAYGSARNRDLVFNAGGAAETAELQLQGNINNGAGSVTFRNGSYHISANGNYSLESAGFIVDEGAWLTTDYTGSNNADWRKVGAGVWTISGTGANSVNLKVGGGVMRFDEHYNILREGEVRLDRADGVAADKVTLSAGIASVVLMRDTPQFNSFTFGTGGGILNLNGHQLTWSRINHADSGATIANTTPLAAERPADTTFTYTGNGTYKGSFTDEGKDGAKLRVVYNAPGAAWVLAGQSDNAGGYEVQNGTLVFRGTNTEHVNFVDSHDWLYSVTQSSGVTVKDGAKLHLGHHALLSADVIIEDGGTFEMNGLVTAAQESVAGGQRHEMTADTASLKGHVTLQGERSVFSANIDSPVETILQGNVSGSGQMTKTGNGTLIVEGNLLTLQGGTVSQGGVLVRTPEGKGGSPTIMGTWLIGDAGYLGVQGKAEEMLPYIDQASTGVLALGKDCAEQVNSADYADLYIGAIGTVHYGNAGEELKAYKGAWKLGGGGGELIVHSQLTGAADLIIGNDSSAGIVRLTNTSNSISGNIIIKGSGNYLRYDSVEALGGARISLGYGNSMALNETRILDITSTDARGVLELVAEEDGTSATGVNLTGYQVALGASGTVRYTGALTPGTDDTYRFGGSGTLILDTALDSGRRMTLDGQGMDGGRVVLATDFSGNVTVGGTLDTTQSATGGTMGLAFEKGDALANAQRVDLKSGATLYTAGNRVEVQNLTLAAGAKIVNESARDATLVLRYSDGQSASFADGMFTKSNEQGKLNIVKTGAGSMTLANGNSQWKGTFTIEEGTVNASYANGTSSSFGTEKNNTVYINEGGVLKLKSATQCTSKGMAASVFYQKLLGTGTIEVQSGATGVFINQSESFDGKVVITGNTRMTIGSFSNNRGTTSFNNNNAVANAVIEVRDGSQARVTNQTDTLAQTVVTNASDYILRGTGFRGTTDIFMVAALPQDTLREGALSIDCGSVLTGHITLAADASIASWSNTSSGYGKVGYLGGTILGTISGEGRTLTKVGNERISLRADAANTFGNFVISGSNGHAGMAVMLERGAAVSTESTALGLGSVTLNQGLELRFANAGTADKNITYTYGNAMTAGNNATLRSTGNTTVLDGLVSIGGNTLHLATSGSALVLRGGVSGSGTLALADGADVSLGGKTADAFTGSVTAGSGSTLRLLDSNAANSAVDVSFTGSLNLNVNADNSYTLERITQTADNAALNITMDVSGKTLGTLNLGTMTATNAAVNLQVASAAGLEAREYTLVTGDFQGTNFNCTATGVDYLQADFRQEGSNLMVSLALADGADVWHGEESAHSWDAAHFTPGTTIAVFNDTAENRHVLVGEGAAVSKAVVDANADYTFTGDGGTAAVGSLTKSGAGTAVLERGAVQVTGVTTVSQGVLAVKDTAALQGTVSGEGTLRVDWGADKQGAVTVGSMSAVEAASGSVAIARATADAIGTLRVKAGAKVSVNTAATQYAAKAIVEAGGTLESIIGATGSSAVITKLEGEGTLVLRSSAASLDLGNNSLTQGSIDAADFNGTLRLGDGKSDMRFRSSNVTGISGNATIEVADKTQYWVTDNGKVVNANLILHGNSGASLQSSWNNEGFGAVRDAAVFNGDITIDGNAMMAGSGNVTFNGDIKGEGADDTLTLGCHRSGMAASTYTISAGVNAAELANIAVRLTGSNKTTVNVNSENGLAKVLRFAAGTGSNGEVNVNASNSIRKLLSEQGDGVVKLAKGNSLTIEDAVAYGGQIKLADAMTLSSRESGVRADGKLVLDVADDGYVSVQGRADGGTRIEQAVFNGAEGMQLQLTDIILAASTRMTDVDATLIANGLKVEAQVGGNLNEAGLGKLNAGTQLLTYGDMGAPAVTVEHDCTVTRYTLDNISGVRVEGDCLVISVENGLTAGGWVSMALAGEGTLGQGMAITLEYTDAQDTLQQCTGYYHADFEQVAARSMPMSGQVYFNIIPEPATAALSLTALAALAFRRRRR